MMTSTGKIQIIENLGLIIVWHTNLLNQQSIGKVIAELKSNPLLQENYSILIDIRQADISLDLEEIEGLSNFVYENLNGTGLKKFAILASESQSSKAVHFVRNYKHSSRYQIFSTLEAALNWLKVPLKNKSQIEIQLGEMNT